MTDNEGLEPEEIAAIRALLAVAKEALDAIRSDDAALERSIRAYVATRNALRQAQRETEADEGRA